jgi:hypothetical protein
MSIYTRIHWFWASQFQEKTYEQKTLANQHDANQTEDLATRNLQFFGELC